MFIRFTANDLPCVNFSTYRVGDVVHLVKFSLTIIILISGYIQPFSNISVILQFMNIHEGEANLPLDACPFYIKQMNVVSLYLVLVFISKTYDSYMKLSINKCTLLLIFHCELVTLVQL